MKVRNAIWWVLRILNLSLLFGLAAGTGLLLGTYSSISEVIPNVRDLGDIRPGSASRVLSAEGEVLASLTTEHRQYVDLDQIPTHLQQAVVAVEDREFHRHVGVDPKAIVRAAVYDVIRFGARQGGSTITQQLARDIFLTRSKTLARKLAEAVLALQLERAYTKSEILELYLNQIYFGEGSYGVQIAAKTYFGKDVKDLDLTECALLAGLPKRPEYYSPFEDEQRSRDRRNLVLAVMADQGYLTKEQAKRAQAAPLKLVREHKPLGLGSYRAPYFSSYILRQVADRYGPDALYKGGLTIQTTLNLEMQQAAEDAVKWGMEQARRRGFNVDHAALVAVDPRTGAVKAMVGGADFSLSQYNRAVQGGRQAGSAFKPFVYTAALEQGYTPDSIVKDTPVSYTGAQGKPWRPQNYDGKFHGPVTFRKALADSYNVCAVKVADMVGIGAVIDAAARLGIRRDNMEEYLPLAIGYCDVSPLEMASAYAVFATRGLRTEPYAIQKIVDPRGQTVEQHKVVRWRVLDERVAQQMGEMLADVIRRGTAAGIRGMLKFPAAGKTGTSNEYKDAWFIGFTDDLSAAVWMGNDAFKSTKNRYGKGVSGATVPAPMWARFMVKAQPIMQAARAAEEPEQVVEISPDDEAAPEETESSEEQAQGAEQGAAEGEESTGSTVTKRICPTSGLLAGPYCPQVVEVTYDLKEGGKPPEQTCDVHRAPEGEPSPEPPAAEPARRPARPQPAVKRVTLPVCAISGMIASARCPIVVNRTFNVDDAPTETCNQHLR